MTDQRSGEPGHKASAGTFKMLVIAACAFGFAFSLVPLYRVACERVFGIRMDNTAAKGVETSTASDRWITVEFDGSTNSKLPWDFRPSQFSMKVQPGKLYDATYIAHNKAGRTIVGSAVPSVAPARASSYFNKTECFCFTSQTMTAGETRDMPLRFIIDPALPDDVSTITLSYAFFKNNTLTAQQQGTAHTASAP